MNAKRIADAGRDVWSSQEIVLDGLRRQLIQSSSAELPSRELSKPAPPLTASRLSLLCVVGEAKAIKRSAKNGAKSIDGSILEAFLIVTMHGREP